MLKSYCALQDRSLLRLVCSKSDLTAADGFRVYKGLGV